MNKQEMLQWAKAHIKDLKIDNDRLYYAESNKVLLVLFANKHKLEIREEEGINCVRIQVPREGINSLVDELQRSFESGE
ncbi:MAG: hypothetical protein QW478_13760 [Candidatus Micrarchaeaceae archaeon]